MLSVGHVCVCDVCVCVCICVCVTSMLMYDAVDRCDVTLSIEGPWVEGAGEGGEE
jgi:hypothetical protein